MILPKPEDVLHKNQMFRLLREILSNKKLASNLMFKGGTYAALIGVLDRFSIDLDFDLPNKEKKDELRQECHAIFKKLDLDVKDESANYLQFFLKYESKPYERNTIKLEINDDPSPFNRYEKVNLEELNLLCNAHTKDTMFANKLVASIGRYEKNKKIAGRDFYDIHKFFLEGILVNKEIVEERTKKTYPDFLQELILFTKEKLNNKILNQDLNPLLPSDILQKKIKTLKPELIIMLEDELRRSDQ